MGKTTKLIKGLDEDIWKEFRAWCLYKGYKVSYGLSLILKKFFRKEDE